MKCAKRRYGQSDGFETITRLPGIHRIHHGACTPLTRGDIACDARGIEGLKVGTRGSARRDHRSLGVTRAREGHFWLLGAGVLGNYGASGGPVSLGPANGPHLPALAAAAEEPLAAIGLESGDAHAGRHRDTFQDLTGARIDV